MKGMIAFSSTQVGKMKQRTFAPLKYLEQCQKHCSSLDYGPQYLQEFRTAAIYIYLLPLQNLAALACTGNAYLTGK